MAVLHRYGVSIRRVADILARAQLLDDDRIPCRGRLMSEVVPGERARPRLRPDLHHLHPVPRGHGDSLGQIDTKTGIPKISLIAS